MIYMCLHGIVSIIVLMLVVWGLTDSLQKNGFFLGKVFASAHACEPDDL